MLEKIKNRKYSLSKLSLLMLLPIVGINEASAHGYSTYPLARQAVCASEGGVWSGTPPMLGCAVAKEQSGTYPFVQINEFSVNIADYNNQAVVEAAVPDGSLCSANDPRKVGMSAVNDPSAWTRTTLNAGTFTYTFNATAPHNPSFWKFYITKQGTDLTQPLKWSDLELIKEDNNTVVGSNYSTDIAIPSDRSGDHIFFVRWQRIDAVGEGFYNCSDITVVNDGVVVPPPKPVEPYLMTGAAYTLPEYNVGERVVLDVLNDNGAVQNTFSIDVTESNVNYIPELLAADVSGYYKTYHNGDVFIGAWHDEMNHYMYFKEDGAVNYFNSRQAGMSYSVKVEPVTTSNISLELQEFLPSDHIVEQGSYANLVIEGDYDEFTVTEVSNTGVEIFKGAHAALIGTDKMDKSSLPVEVTLMVTTNPNGSDKQENAITFTVQGDEVVNPNPTATTWDDTAIYVEGDVVTYNNVVWKAHWWVKRGSNPEATYNDDVWGVWRPVSN